MDSWWFGLLDMAVVAIPVTVIGVWQLVSVNREIAKDKAKKNSPESDSPESSGHPIGEHRLDDR